MQIYRWNHNKTTAIGTMMKFLLFMSILIQCSNAKVQLCDVETGQTNIILDIEESRGDQTDQNTSPLELPIHGDTNNEISLELVYQKTEPVFEVIGKKLKLLKPLDRDKDNLSHIIFQVSCTVRSTDKNRNIPIIVRVSDVNDNAPIFVNTPYEVTVPEATPIGSTIFRNILATDKDAGVNGLVEYFLVNSTEKLPHYDNSSINIADGYDVFAINYPHQGQVTVAKALDFERVQRYYLTVVVSDRARNSNERLSATTTLVVNIADSDDLDPSFIYRGCVSLDGACINPEYSATIPQGTLQGVLNIHPERIQAVDLDKMSLPIKYSFINGNPNTYDDYFEIDKQTGSVSQKKLVDSSVTARQFEIIVQAEEVSEARRTATAKLTINVKPVDSFPPTIQASAIEGFVDEHSPLGTKVLDGNGNQIKFITTDADIQEDDLLPEYSYELTTPSFRIDKNGLLVVNDENLDCDPPNLPNLRFQVVAREVRGNAASTPLSISVNLNDINDNSPKLTIIAPVELSAGNEKRLIAKANATDIDRSVENANITYSIFHVSNNGLKKFSIDSKTGEIYSQSKVIAGERYSITVQASDIGNLYSRSIVEVNVIPGPNQKPPKFVKSVYDVQVKENIDLNSTIVTVHADDPESEQVQYALISGNDLRQFMIGAKTGVISVIRKLDREQITRYQLIIRADDNGGLSSTATVNIKVDDINDNSPKFDETMMPFIFSVDEGHKNRIVGIVNAYDNDEGINAKISYSISEDVPFVIEMETGEIRTKEELDYEKEKKYEFMVTAQDSAIEPKSTTTTVIVNVKDVSDELPKFNKTFIEIKVPENIPNLPITTVTAFDADSVPEITYKIINGGSNMFKIDVKTGEIRTLQGLDYETEKEMKLIVGTVENTGRGAGDTIEIRISVEDQNDNAPVFPSSSETITISSESEVGAEIHSMSAYDSDGTSPSNSIQYEIIGRGKAMQFFKIDTNTGDITLIREFKNGYDSEYQLDIKAHDLGEPQLSSVSSLIIYVKNSTFAKKNESNYDSTGISFHENKFILTIPEMTAVNTTLKSMQILKSNNKDFKCDIISQNSDTFGVSMQFQKNSCDLILLSALDYEKKSTYKVEVKLSSMKARVNPLKSIAIVEIMVQNQNDNSPYFKMPHIYSGRNDTIYNIVEENTLMNAILMQVKATDLDSDIFGMIKYRIMNENGENSYLQINEDNGVIKTRKPIEEIQQRPIRFIVEASDNNGIQNENTRKSVVRVVINVISDINRMSLALSGTKLEDIMKHSNSLQHLLEKKTDLIIFIEKFTNRQEMLPNGNIIETPNATDVWFYAMDKTTELILERNSSIIIKNFFEENAQNRIRADASSVTRSKALGIYAPIENKRHNILKTKATVLTLDENLLPLILLIVSTTILIIGTIGIIYICISWSRYDNFKKHMRHYSSNANNNSTSYDPVIVNTHENESATSHSKQYETQVLGMSVNEDNDDLQNDFDNKSKSQTMRIEKRNFTHKDQRRSPTNSETSTVVIGTSNRKNKLNLLNNNINNKQNMMNKTIELNRNYTNHPSMEANMLRGRTTLTLGRLKSERNQIINGYEDTHTLTRNNLTMARNNTFSTSTLGRNNNDRQNYSNLGLNNLGFDDNRYDSAFSHKYRFNAVLPVTDSIYNRHQHFGRTPCETDENVFFGSNLDYSNYEIPFDLDRSEQETTTEL